MSTQSQTFKSVVMEQPLPSCLIDLNYFTKLFTKLEEIAFEAIELEKSELSRDKFDSDESYESAQQTISDCMKVAVHIKGKNGEYLYSQDRDVLEYKNLPNNILSIAFDNSSYYRILLNREPINTFLIEFDFSVQKVFDSLIGPSDKTPNTSRIRFSGTNNTWVRGSYQRVMNDLNEFTTARSWLHQANIYDFYIWYLVIPILFIYLFKFESTYTTWLNDLSVIFSVALHVYLFFFTLLFFSLLFKYARWLSPYMELKNHSRKYALTQRTILFVVILSIIGNGISYLIF